MIIGQLVAQPGEQFPIGEDFTAELDVAGGEVILAATATSRNYATGADTTSTFLANGAPAQVDDGVVVTTLKAFGSGVPGETHIVQIRATTNRQSTYEHEIEIIIAET